MYDIKSLDHLFILMSVMALDGFLNSNHRMNISLIDIFSSILNNYLHKLDQESLMKKSEFLCSQLIGILMADLSNYEEKIKQENKDISNGKKLHEINNIYHRFINLIKLLNSCPERMKHLSSGLACLCLNSILISVDLEREHSQDKSLKNVNFIYATFSVGDRLHLGSNKVWKRIK